MIDDTKIQQFVLLAKGARGRGLADLVVKATSEQGLFGFSELLAMPQIQEIAKGEHALYHNLLQLFAYGTWPDYLSSAYGSVPELSAAQANKLKQLTVVTLALQQKVIPYSLLQTALQIDSVRALEDYLITECFYGGLLRGKLDQKAACVQVHDVIGRDVKPDQLPLLVEGMNTWLLASEALLTSIEDRINDADKASQIAKQRKETAQADIDDMKRTVRTELEMRSAEMLLDETNGMDFMEEDRLDRPGSQGGFDGIRPPQPERPVDRGDRHMRASAARSKKRIQR